MKKKISIISVLIWTQWFCIAQTGDVFRLKVGAARIDVTPSAHPVAPATDKYDHERLYVRAIVLDNGSTRAALINIECRITELMWANVYKQITAELNCPVENVIIADTHTHSNNRFSSANRPYGANTPPLTEEEVLRMADGIVEAVRKAKAKIQPAYMGFGRGMAYLNVNRDAIDTDTRKWTQAANLDGWSDKSVDVIKFETPDGNPIAVFVNYAMHPINGYELGVYSADFPGSVCRYVEKAFNDEIIVAFSQGAEGDQNPLYLRPSTNAMASRIGLEITGYELNREETEGPLRMVGTSGAVEPKPVDAKVLDDLFRFIESQGQILGEEVIRVMTITKKMTGSVYIAGQEKVVTCPGRKRVDGTEYDPATRAGVGAVYVDAPDVSIKVGVLGIGTTVIVRLTGSIFSYIGQRLKKESPLTNTMYVKVGGPGSVYIPNDAAYGEQTYQVLRTPLKPGCAEEAIVSTLVDMVTEYIEK